MLWSMDGVESIGGEGVESRPERSMDPEHDTLLVYRVLPDYLPSRTPSPRPISESRKYLLAKVATLLSNYHLLTTIIHSTDNTSNTTPNQSPHSLSFPRSPLGHTVPAQARRGYPGIVMLRILTGPRLATGNNLSGSTASEQRSTASYPSLYFSASSSCSIK